MIGTVYGATVYRFMMPPACQGAGITAAARTLRSPPIGCPRQRRFYAVGSGLYCGGQTAGLLSGRRIARLSDKRTRFLAAGRLLGAQAQQSVGLPGESAFARLSGCGRRCEERAEGRTGRRRRPVFLFGRFLQQGRTADKTAVTFPAAERGDSVPHRNVRWSSAASTVLFRTGSSYRRSDGLKRIVNRIRGRSNAPDRLRRLSIQMAGFSRPAAERQQIRKSLLSASRIAPKDRLVQVRIFRARPIRRKANRTADGWKSFHSYGNAAPVRKLQQFRGTAVNRPAAFFSDLHK